MKCLVVHTHPQSLKNLHAVIAASKDICDHTDLLIIGDYDDIQSLCVNKIWHYPGLEHPSSKQIAEIISLHMQSYTHILGHSDTTGKDFLPYFCGQNDLAMLSEVIKIESSDTFQRAIYAGSAIETVKTTQEVKVVSIRGIYFTSSYSGNPEIEVCQADAGEYCPQLIQKPEVESDLPDLSTAEVVVSGGRGFGDKESFEKLRMLAKHFNAAIGASRAAVDAGYISNAHQVGQTGKQIAPRLYFAFGISGAVQHISGMKDSQIIIAIDKDPDAPIFKIAQYGYVGDLFEVIPHLMQLNIK